MKNNLPITAAVDIIKAVREQFGVELKPHSPCGAKGFFLTMDQPNDEITKLVFKIFEEKNASVQISDDKLMYIHNWEL